MQKITQKPWLYKTELCKSFSTTGKCSYGARCQYAHGQAQLRPVTRHPKYKSRRCKNYDLGRCSYGSRCCFIHSNEKKGKSSGQRRRKHQSGRKKSSNRTKQTRARNGSKDSNRGVTRLQQRNMINKSHEIELEAITLEAPEPPPAAKQYHSLHLVSPWSPAASAASISKLPQPVGAEPRADTLVPPPVGAGAGAEPRAESLPNIRSPSPGTYHLKESKPQRLFSMESIDHVKAILEGIGINPIVANPTANPYSKKTIEEVEEDPFGVANPYRAKGNLAPVHPEKSVVAESPEGKVMSWEEKNRGRLNVFKSLGNKSNSCRW